MFAITYINTWIFRILSKTNLTASLISHPISAFITVSLVYIFVILVVYETVKHVLIKHGVMELPGKEFFIDTPVHCAHVYAHVNCALDSSAGYFDRNNRQKFLFKRPIIYNLEFGPSDYDQRNPDYGTTLGFTRNKILQLFINSHHYKDQVQDKRKTLAPSDLKIYHKKKLLVKDDEFLCLLGVETGHKLECFIDLN